MTGESDIMTLLGAGVPVTLLLDLLSPPDADELLVREGGVADWLDNARHDVA